MSQLKLLLPLFAFLVLCLPVRADEKADRLLKQVEYKIASLSAVSMVISTTVRDKRTNRPPLTIFKGTAHLARRNLARIDYRSFVQMGSGTVAVTSAGVVAADGKSLWVYDSQKNQYRKNDLSTDGYDISLDNALPLNGPIYSFFHGHVPHTDIPPAYLGKQDWAGKFYQVVQFRQGADSPNGFPIDQRLYIGSDYLIHRFLNNQMGGQYVEDCVIAYNPVGSARLSRASFAYVPPAGATKYETPPPPMLPPGTAAPELVFEDRTGKPLQLSAMRGKVVVLDFWAIGCGHCLESQAHMNAVAKKFAGKAVIVALDVQDSKTAFTAWLAKHHQYPALFFALAPNAKAQEMAMMSYEVPGLPTVYVIDEGGKVAKTFFGYDGATPDLGNAVQDAIGPGEIHF